MTRRIVTEKETCAQVVIAGTMPATPDNIKEEIRMKKVTVKELREQAKAAGIKGYSRMTKADLEAALENHALTESIKAEYFRIEQKQLAEEVIDELRSADTSSEKTRILEEADYFTLEGIAIKLGMTLPQMPDEDVLRERLIAVFVKPEATKTSTGLTVKEIREQADEEDENRRVSLEEYYEEKMRRDLNEFVKRLYGNDSEIEESADESKDAKTKAKKEAQTEYYMRPESEEEELDDLLPDVIGYVHGQAIRRSPDYTEDSIDIEEMERESAGIRKLDAEDLKNELRSLNRAELDYLCQKFGIKVISEASKAEKRQKLLKYLEEGDESQREKGDGDSKVA